MNDSPETTAAPKRSRWRTLGRLLLLYVVVPYVAICALLTIFQRSLIYVPTREETLTPADAGLGDRVTAISIETHDGLTLNGWHVRPPGVAPEADPEWLVLYFHGNAGNRRRRVVDCNDFAILGLDVFLFDYRGYGDNPGSPCEEDIARDAAAVWRFATTERGFAPDRVLIYGESLGGGVATRLAAEVCDAGTPPGGLILSSTFSSLPDAAARQFPWLPVRWLLFERYPSVERIPRITCPIVVVHGEEDRIVPFALGRRLFDAAPEHSQSGVAKRFVAYPGRGHNDLSKAEFGDVVLELLAKVAGP